MKTNPTASGRHTHKISGMGKIDINFFNVEVKGGKLKLLNKSKTETHTISYKPKIFVTGARGNWRANFTIGVQTFHVCERETKIDAIWYCKVLRTAFKNLKTATLSK